MGEIEYPAYNWGEAQRLLSRISRSETLHEHSSVAGNKDSDLI